MLKQLSKYTLTGGLAALVNFFSRIAYESLFTFNTSLVLAYFTGLSINFCLSRRYVFAEGKSKNITKQFLVFLLVASLGFLVTYMATLAGHSLLNNLGWLAPALSKSLAHIFGIGCGFVANFVGHKIITFKLPSEQSPHLKAEVVS